MPIIVVVVAQLVFMCEMNNWPKMFGVRRKNKGQVDTNYGALLQLLIPIFLPVKQMSCIEKHPIRSKGLHWGELCLHVDPTIEHNGPEY